MKLGSRDSRPGRSAWPFLVGVAVKFTASAGVAWHQFRYDLRAFVRNWRARFFPVALPVLFLVIFALVFTGTAKVAGGSTGTSLYYVPVIITLAIISAASGNLGPRPGPLLLHT
jgi:hypothetical protein